MTKHYELGLAANEEPCPVCGVTPQIFRSTGTEGVVECGRCGLPSGVDLAVLPGDRIPRPAANVAWIGVFRRYWFETGKKITAEELVGSDIELAGRMRDLTAWAGENQDVIAHAHAATSAPYTSLTAICVDVEERGETRKDWLLVLPNDVAAVALKLPFSAEGFALGTIITIQTPIPIPGKKPTRLVT